MLIRNFFAKDHNFDIGKYSFLLGVFFLPTALPIAGIFLIVGLVFSLLKDKFIIFKDKINFSIIVAIFLILLSTAYNFYSQIPNGTETTPNFFLWLNLFNWIPALLCFIIFQNYLQTKEDRLKFSKYFIAGTVPVILSCLFQLNFNIHGPFEILNGLIVWFQKPLEDTGGVAGLFSNRNYAGFWLAVSLPFSLYFFEKNSNKLIKNLSAFLISSTIVTLIILTNSRNAFLGLIPSLLIFFGAKSILFILIPITLFIFINITLPIINPNMASFFPNVFERFGNIFFINSPRIVIFRSVINFIAQKPFLGWGAGTFFLIYTSKGNMWIPPFKYFDPQHSHNLLFEMAFNFGLPASILITSISIIIFVRAIPISFFGKYRTNSFSLDKAWLSASLVVFLMHINDVTFYDGKISLLISILFSGLKCIPISKEKMERYHNSNS